MIPEALLGTSEFQPTAAADTQGSELGKEDFLRMLVAQLEHQDPLNPQDATEFTAQLATFSTLEQLIAMRSGIETLVEVQSAGSGSTDPVEALDRSLSASNLIGRDVLARGAQFQLDPDAAAPRLAFDQAGVSQRTIVEVRNRNGIPVTRIDLGPLSQGPQELVWDGRNDRGDRLPAGVYSFHVDARWLGNSVPTETFVEGRVTGASFGSETPVLMLGDVVVPVSELIEVRERRTGS